jgi:hypothetical protein
MPAGEIRVEKSTGFNDIEVANDGTIYATQTGVGGQNPDASTWQVWKITPAGAASILGDGYVEAGLQVRLSRTCRRT